MANYENFYKGGELESEYSKRFIGIHAAPSEFGFPTDPRTANQLKAVSDKISTGAKTIEFSAIQTQILESIPDQHLEEVNRFRKLAGVDFTFHAPILEPTGIDQGRFDEHQRKGTERQMLSAVERSHKLDPEGNTVVTFHASASIPEPETKVKNEKGELITANIAVVNERDGSIGLLPKKYLEPDYLTNDLKPKPEDVLEKLNKDQWLGQISSVSFEVRRANEVLNQLNKIEERKGEKALLLDAYKEIKKDPENYYKIIDNLNKKGWENTTGNMQNLISEITFGESYIKDAYNQMQNLYNQAYQEIKKEDTAEAREAKKKLDKYREDIKPLISEFKKNIPDPTKLPELAGEISKGLTLLNSISPPKSLRPLQDFAIDKAAQTFSNVAFDSYKKFGNTAPIISIENPPAGSGISRGEELKKLVVKARENFVERAMDEKKMSREKAEKQAEKLIGVTWDVGHINMIRKYGFNDKDIVAETKKIKPYLKHIHLSDNFGYDHTELPMGMGNVPTKKHLEAIGDYNKKLKKIVETGNWFQPFLKTPFAETLSAFGSPIYSMKMSPSWNESRGMTGGYFAGYGQTLPDVHFSTYGAGFAGLPQELGGQIPGNRSRVSGTPME